MRLAALLVAIMSLAAAPPLAPLPRPAPPERQLEFGRAFAASGRIDLFVAATALWDIPVDDNRLWQPVFDLTDSLVHKAGFHRWPPEGSRKGFRSPDDFCRAFNPQFIRTNESHQFGNDALPGDVQQYRPSSIMSVGVTTKKSLVYNIIVSRERVQVDGSVRACLIYVNGDVVVESELSEVVIVCDGDVTINDGVSDSLIVARGGITVKGLTAGSTLIAGKNARIGKRAIRPKELIPVVKENEPNPLGFVTFFELSGVGLQVKTADGALQVTAVAPKSAGEKAGMKAGDVVLDVGGKKPTDAESFRRLLRDALAISDATVKLKRGDKNETVKIALPE